MLNLSSISSKLFSLRYFIKLLIQCYYTVEQNLNKTNFIYTG
jgi:hypothetical protein